MLDPEFKAKWAAALESGEYAHGRHNLFSRQGYCCLGVACIVAGAKFSRANDTSAAEAWLDGKQISEDGIILATDFAEKIGLSYDNQERLFRMNDGYLEEDDPQHIRRHSFAEIATYIKENF